MICQSAGFSGEDKSNWSKTSFSLEVSFTPERYLVPQHTSENGPPDGLQQLVHAVALATSKNKPLRVLGSGWGYEDIAQSDAWLISLHQLNRSLNYVVPAALTDQWNRKQGDPAANTQLVHVEAGVKIIDLIEMLDAAGLAMPTLGGANGQNLAGAISTSTHGGDWAQPPLPDVVRAIHLVTDGGRELWIERASESITTNERLKPVLTCPSTEIVRNDSIFDAVLVSVGRFGVIYSFVLEVRRAFRVVEVVTKVAAPTRAVTPDADDLFRALQESVKRPINPFDPLFDLLSTTNPPPNLTEANGVIRSDKPYFFQLAWNSVNPLESDCYVQRRWITTVGQDLNTPKFETNTSLSQAGLARFVSDAADIGFTSHLLKSSLPRMADELMKARFGKAITEGLRGPHHLLTSGTREDSESIPYTGDYIEIIFDATDERYPGFLSEVLLEAGKCFQAGWISLRPSQKSRALLSMHNVATSHAVSIEVTILKGLPDNTRFMDFVHNEAVKRGGRPHWGQRNKLNEQQVDSLYGPQLQNWRTALTLVSGSSTTFSNNFCRQRGLESSSIQRTVTAVSPNTDEILVFRLGNGPDKYTSDVQYSNWAKPVEQILPNPGLARPTIIGNRPGQRPAGWTDWHDLETTSALPDNCVGSAIEGDKTYVFWIGPDGWVYFKRRGQDGKWSQLWWPIGKSNDRVMNGVPGGAIHALSCQPGILHVFYTDRQGGILVAQANTSGGTTWPKNLWIGGRNRVRTRPGGHITAVSRRVGQLDAFVVGTDQKVYTAAWNMQEEWRGWWPIEGVAAKPGTFVGAVSRNTDLLDIFVADESGKTMSAAWEGQAGWKGWWHIQTGLTSPGGYVTAISRSIDQLDIFTTGTDQRILTAAWAPRSGWGGWWTINDAKAQSLVWPVSRSQDKIDLFFVAPDGAVQTSAWNPNHPWDGPSTIA